ncbi:pyridoxamine 5'-phosphate oxidase family protein [Fulvivirga sp. RKSG066]|uniref:pyridoxamine 5'-phosphate oxidase family protein n=1 Tax=Fulvivirga aurantia TaxID=2529383 RepID=UPI0012BD4A3F|nr:pyridoxamine 5'-phosphate oxidase family protein [Fulvivirga aurantia]MTI21830.1 pyridoxamine 5'-phosphate oxidase family protein [Fulvivirga aurantia]
MTQYSQSARSKVKRVPKRGHYDKETVYSILDAGYLCHVGFTMGEQPFVIPTLYGRSGNKLYLHGAASSRMLRQTQQGIPICLTVTHVDGLVLARSAFHHSMNYRSVVVFGKARVVEEGEKEHALYILSEQIIKGRWDEARKPNRKEMNATTVLAIEIDEASAKIRQGPPADDREDYDLDIWAGVIPIKPQIGDPEPDPALRAGIETPPSVKEFMR